MRIDREALYARLNDTVFDSKMPVEQEVILDDILDAVEATGLTQGDEYFIARHLATAYQNRKFRKPIKNQTFFRILGALKFIN